MTNPFYTEPTSLVPRTLLYEPNAWFLALWRQARGKEKHARLIRDRTDHRHQRSPPLHRTSPTLHSSNRSHTILTSHRRARPRPKSIRLVYASRLTCRWSHASLIQLRYMSNESTNQTDRDAFYSLHSISTLAPKNFEFQPIIQRSNPSRKRHLSRVVMASKALAAAL